MDTSLDDSAWSIDKLHSNGQFLIGRIIVGINKRLSAGEDGHQILEFLSSSLGMIVPFDRMTIALWDRDFRCLRLSWLKSNLPIHRLDVGSSIIIDDSGLASVWETGEALLIDDLNKYSQQQSKSKYIELMAQDGVRSSLNCRLNDRGHPCGLVAFSSAHPNAFNADQKNLLCEAADELSVILEQTRLRDFFNQSAARTGTLNMVLHDLRCPLTIIQGFLEVTRDESWFQNLCDKGKQVFSVVERNTSYMISLLDDFSEVVQMKNISDHPNLKSVRLAEFLSELSTQGFLLAAKKSIGFKMKINAEIPEFVTIDPERIRRVVDNLFTNAVKYSPRNSEITFSAYCERDRVYLSVKDQGQGIPKNELTKLFKEFGRTSTRPTEGEASTGLGLAIAKHFVHQHGGDISVTSQVNLGSEFSFWLPMKTPSQIH